MIWDPLYHRNNEGLDEYQRNNKSLLSDIWTRDDSYPHLSISHFSIMIMTDLCHDLGPYISYNPMEDLDQREISQRNDVATSPCCPIYEPEMTHISIEVSVTSLCISQRSVKGWMRSLLQSRNRSPSAHSGRLDALRPCPRLFGCFASK